MNQPIDALTTCDCRTALQRSRETGEWEACEECGSKIQVTPQGSPRKRDLRAELRGLARWLSTILGRAAGLEPTTHAAPRDGRPDYVDEQHDDLASASGVLGRLESLYAASERGQLAVSVLWAKYVRGELEDQTLGLLFANRATRKAWLGSEKLGIRNALPQSQGKALLVESEQVYHAYEGDLQGCAGWLQALSEDLERRSYEMREDQRDAEERRRRAYQARVLARRSTIPPKPSEADPQATFREQLRELLVRYDWKLEAIAPLLGFDRADSVAELLAHAGLGIQFRPETEGSRKE